MAENYWTADQKEEQLFTKFRLGLMGWTKTGREPSAGTQDVKYYLDLQEQRLKDHGLRVELRLQPEEEIMSMQKFAANMPLFGGLTGRFQQSLYAQTMDRHVRFTRAGKEVLEHKDSVNMYQTILQPDPEDENVGRTPYVCPNCGAVSTVEGLQEAGCPHCGTRYLMDELYPKTSNYYYVSTSGASTKHINRKLRAVVVLGVISGILTTLYHLLWGAFAGGDFFILEPIVSLVLGTGLFCLLYYLIFAVTTLGRLFRDAFRALPLMRATSGSKKSITQLLQSYDPDFSYEYFEGRALSLARILMLCPDPRSCANYRGPDLRGRFDDVVDLQYRGGMSIAGIDRRDRRIALDLKLYFTDTLDKGRKLKRKDETVTISMYHDGDFPVDQGFSLVRVQCHGCGGSFDAARGRFCPYCGREYDAARDDWVVTNIRRG